MNRSRSIILTKAESGEKAPATGLNEAAVTLSRKIAQVCANLKPFQAVEYDPATGMVLIISEFLVPGHDAGQVTELLTHRRADEKVSVKRFADNYKIILTRRIKL